MHEESIYNLIPPIISSPPRPLRYISHYSPTIPPSYSTFCLKTTSKPNIANVGGHFTKEQPCHSNEGETKSFGKLKELVIPSPSEFLRKGGGSQSPKRDGVRSCRASCSEKKTQIPDRKNPPLHGLKSTKNFIVSNALENILSAPTIVNEEVNWMKKPDFAQVPEYLKRIKEQINEEYEHICMLHQKEEEEKSKEKYALSEEELQNIRDGLKKRWDMINRTYQNLTHITKIDTVGLKRKKETCEKELAILEKDMAKLNKKYVFVDATSKTY